MKRTFADRAIWVVVGVLAIAVAASLTGVVRGGPLDPPSPPAATEPQVEPRTPIDRLPFSINQPGSYFLTKNLTGVSGQSGITIASDGAHIDLNGFLLTGVPGAVDGIHAAIGLMKDISVRNGTITSWPGVGINAPSIDAGRYEDLTILSNTGGGIAAGRAVTIRNSVVKANGGNGILVNQPLGFDVSIVENCVVEGSVLDGIQVANGVVIRNNALADNNIGIHVLNSGNRIDGNDIKPGGDKAIKVDAPNNLIVRNSIRGALSDISIVAGNTRGADETAGTPIANAWANITY